MRPTLHRRPRHFQALWLLILGVFAVALNAFGGIGDVRTQSGGDGFYAQICTSKPGAAGFASIPTDEPTHSTEQHGCCKLCGTTPPLLTNDLAIAVSSAPTFPALQPPVAPVLGALFTPSSPPSRGPPRS